MSLGLALGHGRAGFGRSRVAAGWLWVVPALLGGTVTALVMLVLPPDRTLHGVGDFLLKVSPLVCAVATIAVFPRRPVWTVVLPVVSFVVYLGYIDSAFFIQVDRLVQAAQVHAEQAQFSAYYRFSIFANAFVVLSGLFAFRMGGGTSAQVVKLGCAGILVLLSGLNDLTMWAMYDWPSGLRPDAFDWASHVSIFLGREPHLADMLAFAAVHLVLIIAVLRLPVERWIPDRS
ncbi:MAG TPA: hypothetical protein VKV73_26145 [Chloroflexota bacterium]|nr:hypothetical protein [Chloroflexota bacterium]